MAAMLVVASLALYAQSPPRPPARGQSTDQPAPLGSGLAVLATLGLAYGAAKWYRACKKTEK